MKPPRNLVTCFFSTTPAQQPGQQPGQQQEKKVCWRRAGGFDNNKPDNNLDNNKPDNNNNPANNPAKQQKPGQQQPGQQPQRMDESAAKLGNLETCSFFLVVRVVRVVVVGRVVVAEKKVCCVVGDACDFDNPAGQQQT